MCLILSQGFEDMKKVQTRWFVSVIGMCCVPGISQGCLRMSRSFYRKMPQVLIGGMIMQHYWSAYVQVAIAVIVLGQLAFFKACSQIKEIIDKWNIHSPGLNDGFNYVISSRSLECIFPKHVVTVTFSSTRLAFLVQCRSSGPTYINGMLAELTSECI